ncbi:hypothetical protein D3C75_675880 [compost metagenome]
MMEKLYRVFEWLDYEQAKDYLTRLTEAPINTDAMFQLIEEGGLPTWCDLTFICGMTDSEPAEFIYPDERYFKVTRFQHGVTYFANGDGEQLTSDYNDNDSRPSDEAVVWRFKPAEIEALATKMNAAAEQSSPYAAEIEDLRQKLEQEQAARIAAEQQSPATDKAIDPRERATFERLLYVLAREAKYRFEQPYADEALIQQFAATIGAKVPTGKGKIAEKLKAAAARFHKDGDE